MYTVRLYTSAYGVMVISRVISPDGARDGRAGLDVVAGAGVAVAGAITAIADAVVRAFLVLIAALLASVDGRASFSLGASKVTWTGCRDPA